MADRHDRPPLTFRPPVDLEVWLTRLAQRRGVSRSSLIIEALQEKRERDHAAASPR
jgi:predicted transcriptional regulator